MVCAWVSLEKSWLRDPGSCNIPAIRSTLCVVAKWQPLLHLEEVGLANLLCFRRVVQGSEFMFHWENTSVYQIQKGKLETVSKLCCFYFFVKTYDNYSLILNRRSLNSQRQVSYGWMSPVKVLSPFVEAFLRSVHHANGHGFQFSSTSLEMTALPLHRPSRVSKKSQKN